MPNKAPSFILLGDSLVSTKQTFIDLWDYNIVMPAPVNTSFSTENVWSILTPFYSNKLITTYDKLQTLENITSVTCISKMNYKPIFLNLDISASYTRQYCLSKLNTVEQTSTLSNKSWELLEHFIQPRNEINTGELLTEILPQSDYKNSILWHQSLIEDNTQQTLQVFYNMTLLQQQILAADNEIYMTTIQPFEQIFYGLPYTVKTNTQVLEERSGIFLSNFLNNLHQLHIAVKIYKNTEFSDYETDTLLYLEDVKYYKIVRDFLTLHNEESRLYDCTFPADTNILIIGDRYTSSDF